MWANGKMNEAKFESFENLHERTPYKRQKAMNIVLDTNCLIMAISAQNEYYQVWQDFLDGSTFCA